MFSTLADDFRNVELVESGQADETTPRLSLYGEFHPVYGYPQRYRRITWSQGREQSMAHRVGRAGARSAAASGAELEVSWEVVRFTPGE